MVLAVAAGVRAAPASDPLQINQVVELTGAHSVFGDAWRSGVEMAAQEINAGGGLLGRMVQVTTFDAQSTAAGARTAMTKALETEPLAVLGPVLPEAARGAASVPRGNRVLLLGATAGDLTGAAHPCTFRATPSDAAMMTRLAGWLHDGGHARRLAIAASPLPPYREAAEALARAARAAGIEIAAEASGNADLLAELPRLIHATPDALAILLPADLAGRVAAEARRMAAGLLLAGGGSLIEAKALDSAGAAAEGLHAHVLLADDAAAPELAAFRDRYLARNKEAPNDLALAGYRALGALRAAVEQAGAADWRTLCDTLHHLQPTGAQRRYLPGGGTWDADGEPVQASWLVEIRQGRPVVVQKLSG